MAEEERSLAEERETIMEEELYKGMQLLNVSYLASEAYKHTTDKTEHLTKNNIGQTETKLRTETKQIIYNNSNVKSERE